MSSLRSSSWSRATMTSGESRGMMIAVTTERNASVATMKNLMTIWICRCNGCVLSRAEQLGLGSTKDARIQSRCVCWEQNQRSCGRRG
jgi:hypothetical protein